MKLTQKFPVFYHKLLPDLVSWEVPDERFSDCSNCHLCASDKLSVSTTKCCTYHAIKPNYMVGAILSDEDPEWQSGLNKIREKITNKVGVTPYGIAGTPGIVEFNKERRKSNTLVISFEDRAKYACPYLDNGRCSVWKYRGELCITFFCHPVAALKGNRFWGALFQYIRYIERSLSLHAMMELGYPAKHLNFKALEHDSYNFYNKDGSFRERLYSRLWRKFEGIEIDFYQQCFRFIESLDAKDIKQILGIEGEWRMKQCEALLASSKNNIIPDGLVFDEEEIISKLNSNLSEITAPSGKKVKVNMKTLLALKMLDGTRNVQDLARDSKMVLNLPPQRVKSFIDLGIIKTL